MRRGRTLGPQSGGEGPDSARALLVTGDDDLLDAVLRLAAAAGATLDVAHDVAAARRGWTRAPMVVVGQDLLSRLATAAFPRRPGVLIVGLHPPDESVWQQAVTIGAERALLLPEAEPAVLDILADATQPRASAPVVGVIGGQGGSGASVLVASLARAAARGGLSALAVDADALGGGLDLVVGADAEPGLRWPDLVSVRGRLRGSLLRESLPEIDGVWVLSHGRSDPSPSPLPEAVHAVVESGRRGFGLVVIDLPRHLDLAATSVLALCDVVVLLVRDEVRAVAAASVVSAALARFAADVRLVVRAHGRSGLGAQAVASALSLHCAGEVPHVPGLARDLDAGVPPGASGHGRLNRVCDRLLDDLVPGSAAA